MIMNTNNSKETHSASNDAMKKVENMLSRLSFEQHPVSDQEVDQAWEELKESKYRQSKSKNSKPGFYLLAAAVSILLLAFFTKSFWIDHALRTMAHTPQWIVKSTEPGQKLTTRLPDGSTVVLNAASSLRYNEDFLDSAVRIVHLEGEAFFDVKNLSDQPFIVRTGSSQTKVLGTKFNVKAYQDSDETTIALVEGKVEVGYENLTHPLNPGQMLVVHDLSAKVELSEFDVKQHISWKDGVLVCYQESLQDLTVRLERWFGVDIQILPETPIDSNWRFHGEFRDKSLAYILDAISYPDHFKYKIEDKTVTIY